MSNNDLKIQFHKFGHPDVATYMGFRASPTPEEYDKDPRTQFLLLYLKNKVVGGARITINPNGHQKLYDEHDSLSYAEICSKKLGIDITTFKTGETTAVGVAPEHRGGFGLGPIPQILYRACTLHHRKQGVDIYFVAACPKNDRLIEKRFAASNANYVKLGEIPPPGNPSPDVRNKTLFALSFTRQLSLISSPDKQ